MSNDNPTQVLPHRDGLLGVEGGSVWYNKAQSRIDGLSC
jgi:hypothetical protein